MREEAVDSCQASLKRSMSFGRCQFCNDEDYTHVWVVTSKDVKCKTEARFCQKCMNALLVATKMTSPLSSVRPAAR